MNDDGQSMMDERRKFIAFFDKTGHNIISSGNFTSDNNNDG